MGCMGYSQLMGEASSHIVLTLDTKEPIELGDFLSAFTALSSQFEKYIKASHPDLSSEAKVYVREVIPGSIVADMIPLYSIIAPLISEMDKILIVEQFVRQYGKRLQKYLRGEGRDTEASRSDLKEFCDAVAAIAKDPDGSGTIEAAVYKDGKRDVRAAFKFTTKEAQLAVGGLNEHRKELEAPGDADHKRVVMVFSQSNVKDSPVGKRTSERVVIEALSSKDLPLIYASELAEQRIKHEIRDADDNVFKKGFVVDVNVELRGGKEIGYRITNVHQVFDLPDD